MKTDPILLLLAMVIVAAIIVAAFLACLRRAGAPCSADRGRGAPRPPSRRAHAAAFSLVAPATPLAHSAMRKVAENLTLLGAYGAEFLDAGPGAPAPADSASALLSAATPAVAAIVRAAVRAAQLIERTPPSFYDYQSLYTALSGSDQPTCQTARSFVDAGRQAADAGQLLAGAALIRLGGQIRALARSVHALGAALDME